MKEEVGVFDYQPGGSQIILIRLLGMNPFFVALPVLQHMHFDFCVSDSFSD